MRSAAGACRHRRRCIPTKTTAVPRCCASTPTPTTYRRTWVCRRRSVQRFISSAAEDGGRDDAGIIELLDARADIDLGCALLQGKSPMEMAPVETDSGKEGRCSGVRGAARDRRDVKPPLPSARCSGWPRGPRPTSR